MFRQQEACYCSSSFKEVIVVSVSVIVRRFNFLKHSGLEFYLGCCFPSCLVVYIGIGSLLKPLFRLLLRPLLVLLLRPLLMLLLRTLIMLLLRLLLKLQLLLLWQLLSSLPRL